MADPTHHPLDYSQPTKHDRGAQIATRISLGAAAVEIVAIVVIVLRSLKQARAADQGMADGLGFAAVFFPAFLIGLLTAAFPRPRRSRLMSLHLVIFILLTILGTLESLL